MTAARTASDLQPLPSRSSAFDVARFLCAILILVAHSDVLMGRKLSLPHEMLSVDLFFMISGFLLYSRYQPKFAAGALPGDLAFDRLARILPIAYMALALGVGAVLFTTPHPDRIKILAQGVAALVMAPFPSLTGRGAIAPLDFPFWTLIWEVWINLLLIFGWRWVRGPVLAALITVTGGIVLATAWHHGSLDIGYQFQTVVGGAARAGFAFCIGIVVARVAGRVSLVPRVPAGGVITALMIVLAVPVPAGLAWVYEMGTVVLVLPGLIWLGATATLPKRRVGAATLAGDLYYGVYAFHAPALLLAVWLRDRAGWASSTWLVVPLLAAVVAFSHLVSQTFDPWARRWARAQRERIQRSRTRWARAERPRSPRARTPRARGKLPGPRGGISGRLRPPPSGKGSPSVAS